MGNGTERIDAVLPESYYLDKAGVRTLWEKCKGSGVGSGGSQIIMDSDIYSREERVVGKYVNSEGKYKPIYRKVFDFTTPLKTTAWFVVIPESDVHIETSISIGGQVITEYGNGLIVIADCNGGEYRFAHELGAVLMLIQTNGYLKKPCSLCLEWTKTTDEWVDYTEEPDGPIIGVGGTQVKVLTKGEYRNLTEEEKQKDTLYVVSENTGDLWWSPKMTSHTSPAPYVVTSSKEYTGNVTGVTAYSWHAFNGVIRDAILDNTWYSTASARWIQIDFGNLDIIAGIRIYPSPLSNAVIAFPKTVTIKTSIDGTNWTTVFIGAVPGYDPTVNFDPEEIDLPNVAARIVRIECGAGWNGINQTVINDIQFKRPTSGGKLYYKGNVVLSEGGSSEPQNVYSEEETVIGTYFDKPLYRKVFFTTTVSPINTYIEFGESLDSLNIEDVVNLHGSLKADTNSIWRRIPDTGTALGISQNNRLEYWVNNTWFVGKSLRVYLEYTKTTDS